MYISQLDADLAAIDHLDVILEEKFQKIEQALDVVNEISTFGLTEQNFTELQKFHPELQRPELELSAVPIMMGNESVGNEAIAALSMAATAAIIAALAAIFGWIVSKLFGGSSGGSGFGGGSASYVSKVTKSINIQEIDNAFQLKMKQSKKKSEKDSLQSQLSKIKFAAVTNVAVESGDLKAAVKYIESLTSSIIKLISDGGFDDKEALDVLDRDFVKDYSALVGGLSYLTPEQQNGLSMKVQGHIDQLGPYRETFLSNADVVKSLNINPGIYKGKSPTEISIGNDLDALEKDFEKLQKKLSADADKIEGMTLDSEQMMKAKGAANHSLRILVKITGALITKPLANAAGVLGGFRKSINGLIGDTVSVVKQLDATQREKVLTDIGIEEKDLNELIASIKKGESADALSKGQEICNYLTTKIELSKEQKDNMVILSKEINAYEAK